MSDFRDIPGFPGYRAGDDGHIYSVRLSLSQSQEPQWRRLKERPEPYGHVRVNLRLDGRLVHRFVHRLVLMAFVGPCPEGMEGCHNDGDSTNNCPNNLRWDTHRANSDDAIRHGTTCAGARNGRAKIKPEHVVAIHRLRSEGLTHNAIGRLHGIAACTVRKILRGDLWRCQAIDGLTDHAPRVGRPSGALPDGPSEDSRSSVVPDQPDARGALHPRTERRPRCRPA